MIKFLLIARAILLGIVALSFIFFISSYNLVYVLSFFGGIMGVLACSMEIKAEKKLEQELKEIEEKLKQAEKEFKLTYQKAQEQVQKNKLHYSVAIRDPRYARINEDIKRLRQERGMPKEKETYNIDFSNGNLFKVSGSTSDEYFKYKKSLFDIGAISIKTQLELINDTHKDGPGCSCTKCFLAKYKTFGPTA